MKIFIKLFLILSFFVSLGSAKEKLIIKQFGAINENVRIGISSNGNYLYQATKGGFVKRDISSNEIIKVFTTIDGLSNNHCLSFVESGDLIYVLTISPEPETISNISIIQNNRIIDNINLNINLNEGAGAIRNYGNISELNRVIYVGSNSGVLKIVDKEIEKTITTNDGLPSNIIRYLLRDGDTLYIATQSGLAKLTQEGITNIDFLNGEIIYSILKIENEFYIHTSNSTIKKVDFINNTTETITTKCPSNSDYLTTFAKMGDSFYCDNIDGGKKLLKITNDEVTLEITDLPDNSMWYDSYIFQTNNTIYVGYDQGIAKIINDEVVDIIKDNNYSLPTGASERGIVEFDNAIYFGTYNGIVKIKNDRVVKTIENNLGGPLWITNMISANSAIYIATQWLGAYKMVNDELTNNSLIYGTGVADFMMNNFVENLFELDSSIYLSTATSGIKKLTNDEVVSTIQPGTGVYTYLVKDTIAYLLNGSSTVKKLSNDSLSDFLTTNNGLENTYSMIEVNNNFYFGGTNGILKFVNNQIDLNISLKDSDIVRMVERNNKIYTASKNGILKIVDDNISHSILSIDGLPSDRVGDLYLDTKGNLWIACYQSALTKITLFSDIDSIVNVSNVSLNWYLHKALFSQYKIKRLELQRGLSKDGIYEPVLDSNGKPITFSVDYQDKNLTQVYDGFFPIIENHIVVDEVDKKGYNLNTPIIDKEWLEGVPRYYRVVAVYDDENGNEQLLYNTIEYEYVEFENRYKPRVDVKSLYGDNLLIEDRNYTISLELTSIDLYEGNISFEVNSTNLNIQNEVLKQLQDINISASERKYIDINISKENINQDENITLDCNATEENLTITLNYIETDEKVITFSFLKERDTRVRASDPLAFKVQTNFAGSFKLKDLEDGTILKEFDIADSNRSADISLILPMPKDYKLQIQKSDGTIVSNELIVTALKARREVYVENAEKLEKGKTVAFSGKISPFDKAIDVDTQVNPRELSGETTKVTAYLTREDGKVIRLMDDSIGVNSDGTFNFNLNILENGTLSLKIESGSNNFGLATSLSSQLIAGNAIGEAIVVVGYNTDEEINTISTSLGDYTVKSLLKREIPLNQIKYLHFDTHSLETSAGTINAETLTKANLEEAITVWMENHLHSSDPYKKPLTIYLIGFDNGENEKAIYKLNADENLLVEDLNSYLNTLQTKIDSALTTDTYKGHLPVNIIVEGANSGSWIDGLTHNGVIVITSANKKNSGGVSNISNEAKSFTKRFYNYIAQGKDIESSFAEAEYQILKDFNKAQEPQLEANGNGIANEAEDRRRVRDKFLESRPLNNERPIITNYRNNTLLNKNFNYRLYLEAIDNDEDVIESFAEVKKPSGEITLVSLAQNSEVNSLFTKEFRDFSEIGVYEVRYFARDSQDNYSLPKRSILKLNSFSDLCGLNEKYENGGCVPTTICIGDQTLKYDENQIAYCENPTCGLNQYLENGKCVDKIITSSGTSVGFGGGGGGGSNYTPPPPMPKNIDSKVKGDVKANPDGSTTTTFDTITFYDKKVDIDSTLTKEGEIVNTIKVEGKNGITLQTKVNLPKDSNIEVTEKGEIISKINEIKNGDIKIEPTIKTKSDGSTENSIKVVKDGKTLTTTIKSPAGSEVEVKENGEVITKMAKIESKDITVEPTLKSDSEGKSESSIKITKNKKLFETKIKTPIGANVEASTNGKIVTTSNIIKTTTKEIKSRVTFEPTTGDISTEFIIKDTKSGKYEFIDIPKGFAGAEINLIEKEDSMEIVMQTPIAQKLKLRNIRVFEKYKLRDINEDFTYLVPNSDDAKVEITKDALSENLSVTLLDGKASIVYPNGEKEELVLNKLVTVSEKKEDRASILLNVGWNLLSIPLDVEINSEETFKYHTKDIWKYKRGVWEKNPSILKPHEGFWINSSYKISKIITGYSYEFNDKLLEEGWNLAGSGKDLINPKETFSFKDVWIYETKNNKWINNPETISQGQGFWVKK